MSREIFSAAEKADVPAQSFETANEVGNRLRQLGWTEEQVGNFPAAMQKMADAMARGNEGDAARTVRFELSIANDQRDGDVAEVTLVGEGKGLSPERISELIEDKELPVALLTEASTQFFADENKVILRRNKEREAEADTIAS